MISTYLFLEVISNRKLRHERKILYFIIASLLVTISISIRPYFLLASILTGFWIPLRSYFDVKKNIKIFYISIFWVSIISICLFFIYVIPFVVTKNIDTFINTIKINSIEYVSYSSFQTIKSQILFLKNAKIVGFSYCFFALLFIFRIIFSKRIINIKNDHKINLYKFDIDLLFISIILPLSIEILILSRHFYSHYMTFFCGYASLSIGLFNLFVTSSVKGIKQAS